MDKVRKRKILNTVNDLYEVLDDLKRYSNQEDDFRRKLFPTKNRSDIKIESENISMALDDAIESIRDAIASLNEIEDY